MAITGDCNFLKNILGFYLQYQFFENFLGLADIITNFFQTLKMT